MSRSKQPRKVAAINQDNGVRWRTPTPESILRDEVRIGYWKAVLSGNQRRIKSALKSWSSLLSVKKHGKSKR